ncbi:MAG: metal ABC transporter solute-binding protein, Zn/Mn family [Candidatus Dormibacteria bacterium]
MVTTAVLVAVAAGAIGPGLSARAATLPTSGKLVAIGAENQYANVISQIGGPYLKVAAIIKNPNTDPHTFEASPEVAELVSTADLVVQNGLGYDSFMTKLEAASPRRQRRVLNVQSLLGLPASTRNPHLWYKPSTMPAVAAAIASDLAALEPSHTGYFQTQLHRFDSSLGPWSRLIAAIKRKFPGAAVATTEPVGDYLLQAVGVKNRTPWTLQADIMNGVDPSPQNVSSQDDLLTQHRVKAFLYNRQVTDSLTASFLALAERNRIPVVGIYETMPTPGFDYQRWMLAETRALDGALAEKRSTTHF